MHGTIEYKGVQFRIVSCDPLVNGQISLKVEQVVESPEAKSFSDKLDAALSRYRDEMAAQEKEAK